MAARAGGGGLMRLEILSNGGDVLIRRDLLRFSENLAVPVVALDAAAAILRRSVEQQFASEGGYASGGWAPLADSTVTEKARKGLSPQILQATGRLKASLESKFDADHIEDHLSPDSLRFGSNVPYGGYHETGTRKMPARPPLRLTDADKVALVRVMQAALLAGVSGARGRAMTPGLGLSQVAGIGMGP